MKKKVIVTIMLALLVVALTACGKYTSSYKALMLVTTNDSDSASMSFSEFKGTKVFKVKSDDQDTVLKCHARLEEGSLTIYCDYDGNKREMFTIEGKKEFDEYIDIAANAVIYIIIEAKDSAKEGSLDFSLEAMDTHSEEYYQNLMPLGSAEELEGRIAVVSVFVKPREDSAYYKPDINGELKETIYNYTGIACEYLEDKAAEYEKEAELIWDWKENKDLYFEAVIDPAITADDSADEVDKIWQYDETAYDFMKEAIDVHEIKLKYNADSVVFLFFKDPETSYDYLMGTYASAAEAENEMVSILSDDMFCPADIAHEMLHLFGAPDLYCTSEENSEAGITEELVEYLREVSYDDIMRIYDYTHHDDIDAKISEITAYYIGWIDSCTMADEWNLPKSEHMILEETK